MKDKLTMGGEVYDKETMFWAGYVYRCWHYYTGETSKEIYRQATARTIRVTYRAYHSFSVELAILKLKETYLDKHGNKMSF